MRWVVLGLALANAAVLSWWQGWLAPLWHAPYAQEREADRLGRQIQPERIRLLDATAAELARRPAAAASEAEPAASAASAGAASAPQKPAAQAAKSPAPAPGPSRRR